MTPSELIKIWVELFNKGNAEAIAELYHPDAINHQVANDPVIGRKNICKMFATEFGTADMTCIIENIFQDGEWGILEWKDPLGLRGCGFFHVVEGKIKFQRGYWDKLSFLKNAWIAVADKIIDFSVHGYCYLNSSSHLLF